MARAQLVSHRAIPELAAEHTTIPGVPDHRGRGEEQSVDVDEVPSRPFSP